MNSKEAVALARKVKEQGGATDRNEFKRALVALLDLGDKVACPDHETAIRMVAANIHELGKSYIEIAVHPETKEVAWTFDPTLPDPLPPGVN